MKKFISFLLVTLILTGVNSFNFSAAAVQLKPATTASDERNEAVNVTVPQIRITTVDGNGTTLQKSDDYVEASIIITDTDGSTLSDSIQIKVRGNSTAMTYVTKKAFTLKFDAKKDVLGMGKAKKWSLLANTFDPTLMRNYIAFDFAQTMGLEFTSEQRYAELWLDDSYRGCYVITEPIEEGFDRVDIDIESNDGMKDFLIEVEKTRVEDDVTYFTTDNIRFSVSEPEEPNDKQLAYIQSTMDDIMDTLKNGDQQEISEKIDVPSFTRFYLLNELYKTVDFDFSSVFFYYKDGVLYCGPAWDYDLAAGNASPAFTETSNAASKTDDLFAADCHMYKYLCSYDWFNNEVCSTYSQYYDYIYNITSNGGLIDTLLKTYGDIYDRNYNEAGWNPSRWWVNTQMQPRATFSDNVEYLRQWLYSRNVWLSNYYNLYLLGDVDGDGTVSVLDATEIQMVMSQFKTFSDDKSEINADFDTDRTVTVMDATMIQRFVAQLSPEL